MKKIILIILIAFTQISISQNQMLTMDDAFIKKKTTLAPAKLKQLMWITGTDDFSYVDKQNNEEVLLVGNVQNTNKKVVLTLKEINEALANIKLKNVLSFPDCKWKNANQFTFETEKKLIAFNLKTKTAVIESNRDFGEIAAHMDVADKTSYVAFTEKNNLFVFDGKEKLIVTNDADENIVNGQIVYRDEFGIKKGTYWSPTGNLLAFYRMDQTMVTDYPIIDWTTRPASNHMIKYPMAGDKSHEVTVGVYNVNTGKTVFLKTGEPKDQYLTNIAWSVDEQHIYLAVLNREQNQLKLNSYNVASGLFEKTLIEEKDEKYIQPMNPLVFVPKHPDQFIWQSERDGFNHLYLYNTSGKLIKQLTKGNWAVTKLEGFDSKGEKIIYTATAESPITRNAYRVDLKKGISTRITFGEGTHTIQLNMNGNYLIDDFQSTVVPRETAVYSSKGKKINVLKLSENPLKDFQLGALSIFKLKSAAGDDLYCRLYKPVGFDSTKKYPTIVYVYGGPGAQMINNTWNGGANDLWFQYMAERGFVVFTLDNRGSENRGQAFEQAVFQHLGKVEMEDQLVGVNYLKSLTYVDVNRMGLMGWSYGGFMTTTILTQHPNIFKAAVAGGPVIDWTYYEVMYTERYMDTPETNSEGYKEANLLNHVDNLQGKLLLIHGSSDPVVVWQHSMQFLKACIDKGKQVDYFVYPQHEHNVIGKDRVHLFQKITDYFLQNL